MFHSFCSLIDSIFAIELWKEVEVDVNLTSDAANLTSDAVNLTSDAVEATPESWELSLETGDTWSPRPGGRRGWDRPVDRNEDL